MRHLQRQFGKRFADLLRKSPTALGDLRKIRKSKVKLRSTSKRCIGYYNKDSNTIVLGKYCNPEYKVISLAHEFAHALLKPTKEPVPGKTKRSAWIKECLNEEATAIIHELKVAVELKNNGLKLSSYENSWLRTYNTKGKAGLLKKLLKTPTSTTQELYPEYYGNWYDSVVPKKKRIP